MVELEKTDLSELEDFETPLSDKPIKPMQMSVQKYEVAVKMAFGGDTLKKIAEDTKLPYASILKWSKDPQFMEEVDKLTLKAKDKILATNIRDLQKTLAARRAKIEEEGGDYSNFSAKDSVTIAEKIGEMLGDKQDAAESNYSKRLEELLLKSMEHNRKTIDITSSKEDD